MSCSPSELISNSIVDPDASSGFVVAKGFWIKVVQIWADEEKDIERPIQPPSHLLPMLKLVVGLGGVDQFDCPGLKSIADV